jgi:hypothetical protein
MQAPCPLLPVAKQSMSFRDLQAARAQGVGAAYRVNLEYAQWLWQHGLPARAILAMDKALFLCLPINHPEVQHNPLPYAATLWVMTHAKANHFLGNPRVHYQHLADRVRGCKACQKALRAWACWHLVCRWRPDLPGDDQHSFRAPDWEATCTFIGASFCEQEAEQLRQLHAAASVEKKARFRVETGL